MNPLRSATAVRAILLIYGCAIVTGSQNDMETKGTNASQSFVLASVELDQPREVQAAVDAAARTPHAIVFVHVDWSPLQPHRETFEKFAAEWTRNRPELPVRFFYIDFTSVCEDYEPITSLPGWEAVRERSGGQPFSGAGEYVWVRNGTLVAIEAGWPATPDELVARTDAIFEQ